MGKYINTDIQLSHGDIRRVSNLSKKFSRINLDIAISYRADLEHVIEVA